MNPKEISPTKVESHNITGMKPEEIAVAASADFGFNISDVEKVTVGYASEVYRATLDGRPVFIRINNDPDVFASEEIGYEIFHELGIPVADVIAYQKNPPSIGHPTIILSAVEGIELSKVELSVEEEAGVYEEMGRILRDINSVELEGFGRVHPDNGTLVGNYHSWVEFRERVDGRLQKDIDYIREHQILSEEEIELVQAAHTEIASLDIKQGNLLHRDLHHGHVFVKDGKVSGVIDLGSLEVGDPRYDIAMSMVFQTPEQQEAFKKGYGPLAEDSMVKKYQLTIAFKKIVFRHKNKRQKMFDQTIRSFKDLCTTYTS